MPRRPLTVRQLALEHDLDLYETLVTLWDNGFDDVADIDDRIAGSRLAIAHRVLGVSSPREMRTVAYWQSALGATRAELEERLAGLHIVLPQGARVLPKGALGKLRRLSTVAMVANMADQRPAERPRTPSVDQEEPAFVWRTIGSPRACQLLTVEDVCRIHDALELEFATTPDPISPPGVRDMGLLESAIGRADTSLGNERKYPTAEMSAAALLHSLAHNHPFFNGNKRTALVSMLVCLDRNGLLLTSDEQTLFQYVLRVAQHRVVPRKHTTFVADREVLAISQWICSASRPIRKGEREIKWRELRRNLVRLGCVIDGPLPGNKIRVKRVVSTPRFLRTPRERELSFTGWYGGEGREINMELVHSLRRTLELDDDAGYDSDYFYGTDPRDPDDFIAQYRNILKRLARL